VVVELVDNVGAPTRPHDTEAGQLIVYEPPTCLINKRTLNTLPFAGTLLKARLVIFEDMIHTWLFEYEQFSVKF